MTDLFTEWKVVWIWPDEYVVNPEVVRAATMLKELIGGAVEAGELMAGDGEFCETCTSMILKNWGTEIERDYQLCKPCQDKMDRLTETIGPRMHQHFTKMPLGSWQPPRSRM